MSRYFYSIFKWLEGEVERILVSWKKGEKIKTSLVDDIETLIRVCKVELETCKFWEKDDDNERRIAIIKRIKKLAEDKRDRGN